MTTPLFDAKCSAYLDEEKARRAVESRGASSRIHKALITDDAETNAIKGLNNDARASIVIV